MLSQETRAGCDGVEAVDPHPFVAGSFAREDGNVPSRQVERAGEKVDEGGIRGAIDGRRRQTNQDRAVALAVNLRAPRPRDHADVENCRFHTANAANC